MQKIIFISCLLAIAGTVSRAEHTTISYDPEGPMKEMKDDIDMACAFMMHPLILQQVSNCLDDMKDIRIFEATIKCTSGAESTKDVIENLCNNPMNYFDLNECMYDEMGDAEPISRKIIKKEMKNLEKCLRNGFDTRK